MRSADPEKTPRILDAAARLFAERPFHTVHMQDIAARADVAKGTLYLHFKDKEALFRAMIADVSGRSLDEAEARIAAEPDPSRQLRIVVRDAVQFLARYPHYLETINRLDVGSERGEDVVIRNRRERLFLLIERILLRMDADNASSLADCGRAAAALLGMIHRVLTYTRAPWPDDLADWITGLFLFGAAGCGHEPLP